MEQIMKQGTILTVQRDIDIDGVFIEFGEELEFVEGTTFKRLWMEGDQRITFSEEVLRELKVCHIIH